MSDNITGRKKQHKSSHAYNSGGQCIYLFYTMYTIYTAFQRQLKTELYQSYRQHIVYGSSLLQFKLMNIYLKGTFLKIIT